MFGLFKRREEKQNTPREMSMEERQREWDRKIERENYKAREEDREAERTEPIVYYKNTPAKVVRTQSEDERIAARRKKIKERDEQLLRELRETERAGVDALKKGGKVAKVMVKDVAKAGKMAWKELGDWADRVAADPKPRRRTAKQGNKRETKRPNVTRRHRETIRIPRQPTVRRDTPYQPAYYPPPQPMYQPYTYQQYQYPQNRVAPRKTSPNTNNIKYGIGEYGDPMTSAQLIAYAQRVWKNRYIYAKQEGRKFTAKKPVTITTSVAYVSKVEERVYKITPKKPVTTKKRTAVKRKTQKRNDDIFW